LSNVSYMNLDNDHQSIGTGCERLNPSFPGAEAHRVMRDVFPTGWSPSKTIFVRLRGDEEKSAVTGVPEDVAMLVIDRTTIQSAQVEQ
jgi:hypothetical protein